MKTTLKSLIALSVIMLSTTAVSAATLKANNSTDDCADGVGGLQQCLDVAVDNGEPDTIQLTPGEYSSGPYVYNAAITAEDSPLTLENLEDSRPLIIGGADSGLLLISSGVGDTNTSFTLRGIVFKDGNSGNGGGLNVTTKDADTVVENCDFVDNQATLGAGLCVEVNDNGKGEISVKHNLFQGNTADSSGGGAFIVAQKGAVTFEDNTFEGNHANTFYGGAASIETSIGSLSVIKNKFNDNHAVRDGGALEAEVADAMVRIDGNLFTKNTSGDAGGAVKLTSNSDVANFVLTNNVLAENSAGNDEDGQGLDSKAKGGAIYSEFAGTDSTLTITHNTVYKNSSQDHGGGISIAMTDKSDLAQIYNNIVVGNTAAQSGQDIYVSKVDGDVEQSGAVQLFHNLYDDFLSECQNEGGNCVTSGENLEDQDPMFVDAAQDKLQLSEGSPAIDQGDPNAPEFTSTDFAGAVRPDQVNSNPDMGAFEFHTTEQPEASPLPPQGPAVSAEGGCSLGGSAVLDLGRISWMLIALAGLGLRKLRP